MISKNQIKQISQLKQKKFREIDQKFIAEGIKVIQELIASDLKLVHIYVTEYFDFGVSSNLVTQISETDLKKISALTNPNTCLAVFEMPNLNLPQPNGLKVALDDVRDPGNLGTIIRLCDWFGISDLICSETSVDVYNPKVVQATMGSMTRVNVHYVDLKKYLQETNVPIYGTFMDGNNIYKEQLKTEGIIVMGNEANGISVEIEKLVTHRISIPRFGDLQVTESLNVATATAITLSEFRR
ncbi:TrmH family RNA methyltransferase [Flavobacterium sp. I3-2]|uniref:TrmH family RNA methyltransferase n=1 Tax=Flavobacterium sp. I3-2 TaxID=2748319 RepID=UPI0015A7FAA8|nr:RNA methyltransferase [Flavobacterium sp. I3-2]